MTMSENKQQQEGISVQKQAERPSDFSSELQKLASSEDSTHWNHRLTE